MAQSELTSEEKQAMSTAFKFRIDTLKNIEVESPESWGTAKACRDQIDALVSAAMKLELP